MNKQVLRILEIITSNDAAVGLASDCCRVAVLWEFPKKSMGETLFFCGIFPQICVLLL